LGDTAFPSKQAASLMNEFAAKGTGVESSGEMIGKTSKHAFADLGALNALLYNIETFAARDFEELLEQRPNLPGSLRMDSQPPTGLNGIVVLGGETPRPHQQKEVALVFLTEDVLASLFHFLGYTTQEKRSSLRERRH
jgi:hypothetical protein